jgi:hypothetical protein
MLIHFNLTRRDTQRNLKIKREEMIQMNFNVLVNMQLMHESMIIFKEIGLKDRI